MNDSDDERDRRRFATRAVAAGEHHDRAGGVVTPIQLSSTYAVDGVDPERGLANDPANGEFVYARMGNPTRRALEERLATLEGSDHALATASGMAAISTVALATLEPGDRAVCVADCYSGTRALFEDVLAATLGVDVVFVDATDPDRVAAAVDDATELVWLETPTNPRMRLCDVAGIADRLDDDGPTLAVDNTFMSPYFQSPLDLGADVAVHSTTKYVNGHSDSVGGAVVTDDDALAEAASFLAQVALGNVLPPFDAWLVLRGLRTLPVRMRQHEANAQTVAEFLVDHDAVEAVHYPGLPTHPQHDLAERQTSGHGGVLSFELAGGLGAAQRFLDALETFTVAVSLGGVESLIEHPAGMTHAEVPAETRREHGITDGLLRVSVGIEDIEDLVADLRRGFAAVERAEPADD
jgi:cystathionine gamma-lyase